MEMAIRDYDSRMGDPASKKFGVFSYLVSPKKLIKYCWNKGSG